MTTADRTRSFPVPAGPGRFNPLWLVLVIVAGAALIAVAAFWLGTRNPSQEAAAQVLVPQIERNIAERTLAGQQLTHEQQDYLNQVTGTPKQLNPGVGQSQQGAAPIYPAPAQAKSGSWEKFITQRPGSKDGPATVKYIETASAKGRALVWIDEVRRDEYFKNISDKPITFTLFRVYKNPQGKVYDQTSQTLSLIPGEVWSDGLSIYEGSQAIELKVEVK